WWRADGRLLTIGRRSADAGPHPPASPMSESLPAMISDVEELEELLSRPTDQAIRTLSNLPGDVMLLGAGGKMGPTLARMCRRASDAADTSRRIIAASRFSRQETVESLQAGGIDVLRGDLLDPTFVNTRPPVPHVIFMVGVKFGTSSDTSATWAMNAYVPGVVAQHF